MIQPTLFSQAGPPAADETFATATRIQLDETSWVDHVQGWLSGDEELMETLMSEAARAPRSSPTAATWSSWAAAARRTTSTWCPSRSSPPGLG
jgi:hypothetical protein